MLEDLALDRCQRGARVDTELLAEQAAGPVDRPQRVSLPVAPVVRVGQRHPTLLAEWLPPRQHGGDRRRFIDPAVDEHRVDEALLREPAHLCHPCRLVSAGWPAIDIGERLTLHQGDGLAQDRYGLGRLPDLDEVRRALVQALETADVDVVVADCEAITVDAGLDGQGPST